MPVSTVKSSSAEAPPAWNDELLHSPHEASDKRSRVQRMFAAIAGSYDFNNRLHSFWIDQLWRRTTARLAKIKPSDVVVDVACGTGDLSLALARLGPKQVIGIDFTYDMLPLAVGKNTQTAKKSSGVPITFLTGDAQALPLPDASADVLTIAFGIRNVQSIPAALAEFRRVLKPSGRLLILEFSQPTNPVIRKLNDLYCARIMPTTATLVSGDKSGAYKYLPMSVETFVSREKLSGMMQAAGFPKVSMKVMTFGVAVCYHTQPIAPAEKNIS